MAQWVKNTPAMQEIQEMQIRFWIQKIPWRRAWQPTSVFLPGKSHGGALQAPVQGVAQSQTRLKRLSMHTHV